MAVQDTYLRPAAAATISTPVDFTVAAGFYGQALAAVSVIAGDGNPLDLDVRIDVDADESIASDIQPHAHFVVRARVNAASGVVTYEVEFQPISGLPATGILPITTAPVMDKVTNRVTFTHPQSMDAFQTAAGRARQ